MLMLVTKILKMNLTPLLLNIKSYLDSNQLAKLLIYQNLNLKRKKRVHLHQIQKEKEEELVSLTIMQKLLKNQVKEQLKNLTSNQRIPLLLEKNRVQRKFKNKLEKHLKNFKARVQKVRVQNTEKRKETNIVKKQKMSLRT
jgi:Glu-tRNA(Gln) amidotransferase subunit E-like FAD-binding protein